MFRVRSEWPTSRLATERLSILLDELYKIYRPEPMGDTLAKDQFIEAMKLNYPKITLWDCDLIWHSFDRATHTIKIK